MTSREKNTPRPTLKSYATGYAFSILITLVAFGLAYAHINSDHELFSHHFLVFAVVSLAIVQLYVQAIFFLHLSLHPEGRYNLVSFIFTIFTVLFIGIGSLWIMHNLNYNMTPEQIDAYLHKEN